MVFIMKTSIHFSLKCKGILYFYHVKLEEINRNHARFYVYVMNIATLNKDHGILSAVFFHMVSSVTKMLFYSFFSIFHVYEK